MKLVVNMVMGSMMCAFGEGLSLCDAVGLDGGQLLQVLDLGAMANPMFKMKGPKMLASDHAPNVRPGEQPSNARGTPIQRPSTPLERPCDARSPLKRPWDAHGTPGTPRCWSPTSPLPPAQARPTSVSRRPSHQPSTPTATPTVTPTVTPTSTPTNTPTVTQHQFPLKHAEKDVKLAVALGQANGLELPVAATSDASMKKAMEAGHGDKDFSAVVEAQRKSK